MPCEHDFLSPAEETILLRIARDALTQYITSRERLALDASSLTPNLQEHHGAFVTLRRGHALRGCIGYTRSLVPLAEAVRDNAINAATRDPRFQPVQPEEIPTLTIEISALCPGEQPGSPFIRVHDPSEILLGRDGLYLESPQGNGLLLPQVPQEQGWNLEQFLHGISRKSGLTQNGWQSPTAKLHRFAAQVFSE